MTDIPFNFSSVPSTWAMCFNENCPKKAICMRHFAAQHLPADRKIGLAVYPNALQKNKCEYFVEKPIVRAAWGFRKLLLNVKYKDEAQLRYEMKQFLGGHSAYYRYMNGKLTLLPELQEGILHLFREYGYTEDLVFDNYINRYVYE